MINLIYFWEGSMFKKSKLVMSVAACLGVFLSGSFASVIEKIEITAQKRV